jgi:hypothetical protein
MECELERRPHQAVGFYSVIGIAIATGLSLTSCTSILSGPLLVCHSQWSDRSAANGGDHDDGV